MLLKQDLVRKDNGKKPLKPDASERVVDDDFKYDDDDDNNNDDNGESPPVSDSIAKPIDILSEKVYSTLREGGMLY